MIEKTMAVGWGSVFDSFGLKTVSRTDKDKKAYLPNEAQRAALAAARFQSGTTEQENLLEIQVLDENLEPLITSYYQSLRVGSGRDPEPRMGRGLVSWAEVDDELVIGNIGERVYVANVRKITPETALASLEHKIVQAFRPRARLLQLLGDQLIGSSKLAVFELVKNAYDADASEVSITLGELGTDNPWITVEDDGLGMSPDTIRNVWLVPGDDYRERARGEDRRSPKYFRLPLGEKGVGRFAVHKLGGRVEMTTRSSGNRECLVTIDWAELMSNRFLDDAAVTVVEREPKVFTGDRTGTRIRIEDLNQKEWSRAEVRDLFRQATSISSPFSTHADDFSIDFKVPGFQRWISELPDASELLQRAPWKFQFEFDGEQIKYTYEFRGVPGIQIEPRKIELTDKLQIVADQEPDDLDAAETTKECDRRSLDYPGDWSG